MYMFITEHRPVNEQIDPKDFPRLMRALLEDFSAPLLGALREQISEQSSIVFRPLEALLMPQPWHKGRVVLIGDAVHATTPHLASGACIGIEDGLVLADCVGSGASLGQSLQAFQDRRWERCRMVVENSLRLGEIEMTNGSKDEHGQIMRESLMALAQPI
jgi:2-polyprenyl-6-methoxyphenol hydroxylase-like FAD-dependent oxidoreductase